MKKYVPYFVIIVAIFAAAFPAIKSWADIRISPLLISPTIIGGTTTANAPTATHANTAGALDSTTQCGAGYYSRGIDTAGSAVGCTAAAGGGTLTGVTLSSSTTGVAASCSADPSNPLCTVNLSGTLPVSISGGASGVTVVDDTTTNGTMYPVWVTSNSGVLPSKVSSSKMTFNPSTGTLTTKLMGIGLAPDNSSMLDVHQVGNTIPMIQAQDSGASSSSSGGIFQATLDNGTAPINGTRIGGYQFSADIGDGVKRVGGAINAVGTETWTSTATGTELRFTTNANGGTVRSAALTLGNDKTVTFNGYSGLTGVMQAASGVMSQTPATINNLAAQTADYSANSHKITNLTPGATGTDAATVSQIAAGVVWLSPIIHPYVTDDSLTSPPGTCVVESAYVAASSIGAWTAGHLYECASAAPTWTDLGAVASGVRFGINFGALTTPAGSFVAKSKHIMQITGGTPGAYTYADTTPAAGDQVFVDGVGGIDYRHIYWYDGTGAVWIDTQGGASSNPAAGYGLTYTGNTILIDTTKTADLTSAQAFTNKTYNGLTLNGSPGSTVTLGTGGTVQYTGANYAIGNGTGVSLAVTGALDGRATINLTTATTNAACSALTCYNYNNTATAGAAVGYTLGTAQAGMQQCFKNYTGKTGILTISTSAAGQFINLSGVLSASGGNITSAGALGDSICLVAVDATHWDGWISGGAWTVH